MNDLRPNFQSILDEAPDEVVRPKPLPVGTYTFVVGPPTYDKSAKKGTPLVSFMLRAIAAGEDVDDQDLEAMGGLEGKTIRHTFYITEDAVYRLDEFHEHCGLDLSDTVSRRTRNDEVVNTQVRGYVGHRQADPQDPNSPIFAEIKRTLAAD